MKTLTYCWLIVITIQLSPAHSDEFDDKLAENNIGVFCYMGIRCCIALISDHFPPSGYHYLGVGRSPAPLIAELQNQYGEHAASSMPLSNFKPVGRLYDKNGQISPKKRFRYIKQLTLQEKTTLFELYSEFLRDVPTSKKILVIDYVFSGKSLISTTHYLHLFFKEQYITSTQQIKDKVHALAIGDQLIYPWEYTHHGIHFLQYINRMSDSDCGCIDEGGLGLGDILHCSLLKWAAEHGKFNLLGILRSGQPISLPQPGQGRNPYYARFRQYLSETTTATSLESYERWKLWIAKPPDRKRLE